MKMAKSMMLMGLGAASVLMYQKYGEDVKKKMNKVVDKTMDSVSKKLECMD